MGSKYEIYAWTLAGYHKGDPIYEMHQRWRGENFFSAIWNFIKIKREGHGMIKLEWR